MIIIKRKEQLDEGQIEEERLLSESLQKETLLKIITWKNGLFTSRVGRVTKIDRYAKKIKILDELDSEFTLNFFDVIAP